MSDLTRLTIVDMYVGKKILCVKGEGKHLIEGDVYEVLKIRSGYVVVHEGAGGWETRRFTDVPKDTSRFHPWHDVIVAWSEGIPCEYRRTLQSRWVSMKRDGHYGWHSDDEYREKPAAPELTEDQILQLQEISSIEQEMQILTNRLGKLKGTGEN